MNFCSFKPLKLWECWLQQHNPDYTSVSGLYYFFSVVFFFFFLIPGSFLLTYHIYSLFISQSCGCVKKILTLLVTWLFCHQLEISLKGDWPQDFTAVRKKGRGPTVLKPRSSFLAYLFRHLTNWVLTSLFQLARLPVGTCFNHFISAGSQGSFTVQSWILYLRWPGDFFKKWFFNNWVWLEWWQQLFSEHSSMKAISEKYCIWEAVS